MTTWTKEQVAARFDEAVFVLHILPNGKGLGYARRWPATLYLPRELARQTPECMCLSATPQQVTRLEEVLTWITWVEPKMRHLIWSHAEGLPWRAIAATMEISKSTAHRHWQVGLQIIADQLTKRTHELSKQWTITSSYSAC